MMVKNEAGTLHRALASAADFVDEICILDTGSTDDTPKIARSWAHRYQRTVIEPFHFADARNMSVRMATSPYVLILDGDEYLEPSAAWQDLRALLMDVKPGSVSVTLVNHMGQGTLFERLRQRRVFRRGEVLWAGRVHHYLEKDPGGEVVTLGAELHHTGFDLSKEEALAKYTPRVALNRQAARENRESPARYAHYRYKLAEALMMTSEWAEAASVFRWCYRSPHLKHIRFEVAVYWLKALLKKKQTGGKVDDSAAAALALEVSMNAQHRKEPVPMFYAAWMLLLTGRELYGLALMAESHRLTVNPPDPLPRKMFGEIVIRRAFADCMGQAGMPALGKGIASAAPEEGARLIQEIAGAFAANRSPLIQEVA